jgi:hypothetical protein
MKNDTYHSKLLTWGIWITGLAAAGFMVADILVRPTLGWVQLMPVYCLAAFALLHSFTFMGARWALFCRSWPSTSGPISAQSSAASG